MLLKDGSFARTILGLRERAMRPSRGCADSSFAQAAKRTLFPATNVLEAPGFRHASLTECTRVNTTMAQHDLHAAGLYQSGIPDWWQAVARV